MSRLRAPRDRALLIVASGGTVAFVGLAMVWLPVAFVIAGVGIAAIGLLLEVPE